MRRYIFSDYLKALGIVMIILLHSLQVNENLLFSDIAKKYYFHFWIYQAVSLFIVITGFHYTCSIENRGNLWYRKNVFLPKFLRIIIPYAVMYFTWMVYALITNKVYFGKKIFLYFLQGGVGPGGYYTVVMLQILVFFPVIYYLISNSMIYGTCVLLGINIVYELFVFYGGIRDSFYRLCGLRLLAGVVLGVLIYKCKDNLKDSVIPYILFTIGSLFLIWQVVGEYELQVIKESWSVSSIAAVPYAGGIISFLLTKEEQGKGINIKFIKKLEGIIIFIGKASYHIFLVQQLWFAINLKYRNLFNALCITVTDVILCVLFGCLFYVINTKVMQCAKNKFVKLSAYI